MGISDRICRVPASGMMTPACCVICGKAAYNTDEEFLDIRVDIDEYGKIYFCMACAKEIGSEVEPTVSKVMYDDAKKLNLELQAQLNELSEVKRIIDGYQSRASDSPLSSSVSVSDDLSVETTSSDKSSEQLDPFDFDFGPTGEESESTESGSSAGPDDADESPDHDDRQLTFTELAL